MHKPLEDNNLDYSFRLKWLSWIFIPKEEAWRMKV